jgi:Ser/Thr protein kinase RdoA (MazF antagonist)
VALAFTAVDGRLPHHPWRQDELTTALDSLNRMHELLTPTPMTALASAGTRLAGVLGGWVILASMTEPPPALDDWSRRHLDRLAELESGWPRASEGTTLLHGDIRSDNMLLVEGGGARFVDWPHAMVGSAVLDVVLWAPSVVLEGGPAPEDLMARHGPSGRADTDVVAPLVAAFAGFLTEHSFLPAPPGLPTLRAFQAAQGKAAREWVQRLTGWT